VRTRVEIVPDTLLPDDYYEYVLFADKCERELLATKNRIAFHAQRFAAPQKPSHSYTTTTVSRAPMARRDADGDVEMVLNNIQVTKPSKDVRNATKSRKPIDKDTYAGLREKNACFVCGKEGHYKKDCPTASKDPRRGARGKGRRH